MYYQININGELGWFEYDLQSNKLFAMGKDSDNNLIRLAAYPYLNTWAIGEQKSFKIGTLNYQIISIADELPDDFEKAYINHQKEHQMFYKMKFGEKIGYFQYDDLKNKLFLMGRDYNKNISRITSYTIPGNYEWGRGRTFQIGMIWFENLEETSELPENFEAVIDEEHVYWKIKHDGVVKYFELEEIPLSQGVARKLIELVRNSNNSICREEDYRMPNCHVPAPGLFYRFDFHSFEFIEQVNRLPDDWK